MKKLYQIVSLAVVLLCTTMSAKAQDYLKYEAAMEGSSFAIDSTDSISDPWIYSMGPGWIDSDYYVKDVISLEIKDNEAVVFPDSFQCSVKIAIMSYDIHNALTTMYKVLTVTWNSHNLARDTLRSFIQFYHQYRVKDSIISITETGLSGSPDIFRLSSSMEISRQYDPSICTYYNIAFTADTQYLADQDELLVTWTPGIPDSVDLFYDGFDF